MRWRGTLRQWEEEGEWRSRSEGSSTRRMDRRRDKDQEGEEGRERRAHLHHQGEEDRWKDTEGTGTTGQTPLPPLQVSPRLPPFVLSHMKDTYSIPGRESLFEATFRGTWTPASSLLPLPPRSLLSYLLPLIILISSFSSLSSPSFRLFSSPSSPPFLSSFTSFPLPFCFFVFLLPFLFVILPSSFPLSNSLSLSL